MTVTDALQRGRARAGADGISWSRSCRTPVTSLQRGRARAGADGLNDGFEDGVSTSMLQRGRARAGADGPTAARSHAFVRWGFNGAAPARARMVKHTPTEYTR